MRAVSVARNLTHRRLGVAALLTACVACVAFAFWQAHRARQAARESAALSAFLIDDVLSATDPLKPSDVEPTMRAMLDRASARLGERFHEQPHMRAAVGLALAKAYDSQGMGTTERDLLESALRDAESAEAKNALLTLQIVYQLGLAVDALGQWDRADLLYHRVLANTSVLGQNHPLVLDSLDSLAYLDFRRGFYAEGLERYQAYLARVTALGDQERIISVEFNLPDLYSNLGRYAEAEAMIRKGIADQTLLTGADSAKVDWMRVTLGDVLINAGRYNEAMRELAAAEQGLETHLGPEHSYTLTARAWQAKASLFKGDAASALPMIEPVYATRRRLLGDDNARTDAAGSLLGRTLVQLGRASEALPVLKAALHGYEVRLPSSHPTVIEARANLAEALFKSGDREQARKLMADTWTNAEQTLPKQGPRYQRYKQVEEELAGA